jgi:hypothetical protein
MDHKSNRGGEGQNASHHPGERPAPGKDRPPERPSQGIDRDLRGEDQPADKSRAQQTSKTRQRSSDGLKAQRDAAEQQPQSPGEPASHE